MKFAILFSRKTYWGEGYGPNPTSHKPPHLGNSHTSHFSLSQKIWTQTFHMLSPLQEKKKKKKFTGLLYVNIIKFQNVSLRLVTQELTISHNSKDRE